MIRRLNLLDLDEVNALLNVQRLAYKVEADLIGFYDIPPLKDTIQSLQSCTEAFYGYFQEAGLFGAISYTKQADEIDICRLSFIQKHFVRVSVEHYWNTYWLRRTMRHGLSCQQVRKTHQR